MNIPTLVALAWLTGQRTETPVVMISAYILPETARRALDHGAAAFPASLDRAAFGSILNTRFNRCAQVMAARHSAGIWFRASSGALSQCRSLPLDYK